MSEVEAFEHVELSESVETWQGSRARPRRLRGQAALRSLVRETDLTVTDLIVPLFVKAGDPRAQQPIEAMPGQFQFGIESLLAQACAVHAAGIPAVMLFGLPAHKDAIGSSAWDECGVVQSALRLLKAQLPELVLMVDVCSCQYTDHGHCGVLQSPLTGQVVDNDLSLSIFQRQAVSLALAGADVIAPSSMMDGVVGAVRGALDTAGFSHLPILSYAAKYASTFYGPFREAADGPPQFGDRRSYQMDCANGEEALHEVALDIAEGADMLMVKPGHTYLDIIHRIKIHHPAVPLAAYHVSGEYAMLKAGAERGWINEQRAVMEVSIAMKRAGANMIITYFGLDLANWLIG